MNRTIGIFDLGTNAFRFILYSTPYNSFCSPWAELLHFKRFQISILRNSNYIEKECISKILASMQEMIDNCSPSNIMMVATEASRKLKNFKDLSNEIKERFKIDVELLSHQDEAKLCLKSIKISLQSKIDGLAVEIGGGSMQFANFETFVGASRSIGCKNLENLSKNYSDIFEYAVSEIESAMDDINFCQNSSNLSVVMMGGGSTDLLNYIRTKFYNLPFDKVHSFSQKFDDYQRIINELYESIIIKKQNLDYDLFPTSKKSQVPYQILLHSALTNVLEKKNLKISRVICCNSNLALGKLYEQRPDYFSLDDPWWNMFRTLQVDLEEKLHLINQKFEHGIDKCLPNNLPLYMLTQFKYLILVASNEELYPKILELLASSNWIGGTSDERLYFQICIDLLKYKSTYLKYISNKEKCYANLLAKLAQFLANNIASLLPTESEYNDPIISISFKANEPLQIDDIMYGDETLGIVTKSYKSDLRR